MHVSGHHYGNYPPWRVYNTDPYVDNINDEGMLNVAIYAISGGIVTLLVSRMLFRWCLPALGVFVVYAFLLAYIEEKVHRALHGADPRPIWMPDKPFRWLQQRHWTHHSASGMPYNFGITWTIVFDAVVGTLK